ncbi:MAG: SDR family oxidoreductase [Planctomycetota bacterium]
MIQPVALVTGSGKERVGNAVARDLASHGYRIAIHYFRSAQAADETVADLTRQKVEAAAFRADLRKEDDVIRLVERTKAHFGRLDVLVCAAAVWQRKSLEATTAADLQDQWEANALSTFLCVKHAGLVMVTQPEGGAIVTIGDWAIARPYRDYAAYFPSKGAIPTMTRDLAVELGERNPHVRVNCILPGPVMLPPDLPAEERKEAIDATLVKREGTPRNVAHAVRFLIENDFITGVCLPVDGGRSIYARGL